MTNESPSAPDNSPDQVSDTPDSTPVDPSARKTNKTLWMGTAVGIGSAAIVAALLYSKRRK